MIAIGPSPDMADLVRKYDCGVIAETFSVEEMAKVLNNLSHEQIDKFKMQSDVAASELCFEQERQLMSSILDRLLT